MLLPLAGTRANPESLPLATWNIVGQPRSSCGSRLRWMTPDCFIHPQSLVCLLAAVFEEFGRKGRIDLSLLWMNAARVSTKVSRLPVPKPALWA
jgi:hypothetical protein